MGSVLIPRQTGPVSSHDRGHHVVSWARHVTFGVPLCPAVY